jgi:hypothetical protein
MRTRVLAAIEELDYRPNPVARTLRTGRTGVGGGGGGGGGPAPRPGAAIRGGGTRRRSCRRAGAR